jgi:hypothetical protein
MMAGNDGSDSTPWECRVNLENLVSATLWTPRAAFPPSAEVGSRTFSLGRGFYLMTNPTWGEGEPVYGVGWAESDYWARRAWENPPFAGGLTPPAPQWPGPPSLGFLGRPVRLGFKAVCAFEQSARGVSASMLRTGTYRLTDGAFLVHQVRGADDVFYNFGKPNSRPRDLPVAIEVRLLEHG